MQHSHPGRARRLFVRWSFRLASALLAGASMAPAAMAQDYPSKPVRIIVPFAPGGSADVFGRFIAQRLQESLGQSFVIDNRPGGGSIIGIASMSSYFGIGIVPGYGAAKTGLVGLTRTLAVQWGPRGVRVNSVAAGLTKSKMTAGTFEQEAWTKPTLDRTPIGRLGVPDIQDTPGGGKTWLQSTRSFWSAIWGRTRKPGP